MWMWRRPKHRAFKYDSGAGEIIESVSLHKGKPEMGILTVKLKKFVPVAPLVRPLSPGIYIHAFWQTNRFDWVYDVRVSPITGESTGGSMMITDLSGNYTFFLELLTK